MKIKQLLMLALVLSSTMLFTGCWQTAQEGTVQVQTINDKITRVIHGGDWTYTWNVLWDNYYEVNMRSFTEEIDVSASSKDNAAFTQKVAVTAHVINENDEDVMEYVRKFGLAEQERHDRRLKILQGHVATEAKAVMNKYDAYTLLSNQEQINKEIIERLKPIFRDQLHIELETVQLETRPNFLDDRIEQAASAVVANQKLKEASEAALAASKVDAEKKQVEAQVYSNPVLLQIRKLELQKEIAEAWSKHSGTLVLGNTPNMQLADK